MTEVPPRASDRRPIATRDRRVVQRFASWVAATGVSPNAISLSSIAFAAAAAVCFAGTSDTEGWTARALWLGAAANMQLRLLANLLDGMVALETGRSSAAGELFNEAPDRLSDAGFSLVRDSRPAAARTSVSPPPCWLSASHTFARSAPRAARGRSSSGPWPNRTACSS
ncbi:MAG: hypothetical protein CMJ18_01145 [Phycisphaeraceae bacterium]|nr:hypothetical protein [Phycisphaeraceae bacterium]